MAKLISLLRSSAFAAVVIVHVVAGADNHKPAKQGWSVDHDAYIESRTVGEQDFDLNKSKDNDHSTHKTEVGYELSVEIGEQFEVFVETELSRVDFLESETNSTEDGWELKFNQAYVEVTGEDGDLVLRFGRQTLKDEMEWLYDADLDGIRLFYQKDRFSWEISVTENDLLDDDILFKGDIIDDGKTKKEEFRNLVLIGGYAPDRDLRLSGYLIFRDEQEFDGNRPEDLYFAGFQSVGNITPDFKHWINAAYVEGERQRSNDVRDIEAHGYDLGLTMITDFSMNPAFTLGYAYGSGDSKRNQEKDTNFRQTGLQDNYFRFNGVSKIKYLGEIFDPEITNISIATFGLGIRPTKKSSLDIVYHIYQQDKAVDRLTGTNLDRDPQGNNKELGREIDIIFASKAIKNLYMEAILAIFEPGDAFKSSADSAYFASFEIGYKF